MPIRAECECGKVYRVKDDLAGRRFRCAKCGEAVRVPEADDEPMEVIPVEEPPRRRSRPRDEPEERRPPKRALRSRPEPEPEEDRPARRRSRVRDEEPEDDEPEPSRKKKKKKRRDLGDWGWLNARFGAVGGGLLAMLIAVVWFVAGLLEEEIFLYPPVLFVLGVISLVKGLLGYEE